MAEKRWLRSNTAEPNKCVGLELSGFRVTPDSTNSHRRGEVKKSYFGFPFKDQSKCKSDEGFSEETRAHTRYFDAK